jgi:hypothetical protein
MGTRMPTRLVVGVLKIRPHPPGGKSEKGGLTSAYTSPGASRITITGGYGT